MKNIEKNISGLVITAHLENKKNVHKTWYTTNMNKSVWILGSLVQVMACDLDSSKPLSATTLIYCLGTNILEIQNRIWQISFQEMHWKMSTNVIYFVQPLNIVNSSPPSATYMHQWTGSALVKVMDCRLFGAMPISEPILPYCQLVNCQ